MLILVVYFRKILRLLFSTYDFFYLVILIQVGLMVETGKYENLLAAF